MDTITTDSGKVLKLEEAYTVDPEEVSTMWYGDELEYHFIGVPDIPEKIIVKRVWVLVEGDNNENN